MEKTGKWIVALLTVLGFFSCSNPVDIVEAVTEVVMAANSRYIEVVSLSPEPSEEIYASDIIAVNFDRDIDPNSFNGNIIVRYNGDSEGTNRVTGEWEIEYDSTLRRLTIDADPWLSSGKTVTVTIGNIKAADSSELLEPVEWSFSTNNRAAFNLTIDAEYANGANYTNIPVSLEFSSATNLYYYLTSSPMTSEAAASSFNPSTWTLVNDTEMADYFSYSSQGISVPLYLWVYEPGGAGILSTNNTTETEYLLVDYTPPSGTFSLPSVAYSSSVTADMSGMSDNVSGIAKYEFSNDGSSSSWTEYPDPGTTVAITIRDNAGPRTVYCRATDNVGNVMAGTVSASTNYYLPVKISLTDITVSDADFLALTEQWYWAFSINGSDAFSRSSTTPLSYGVSSAKKITSAAAAYIDKIRVDKNSAIPYTTTRYVDVASSLGTVVMTGYVAEEDGKIDQITDTNWVYYLSTNARTLSLSTDPGSPATGSYALTADTLSGISIGIDYWATVEYAATGP